MKTTRIEMVPTEVLDDVHCNKCGESCKRDLGSGLLELFGLIEISVSGGWGSRHLGDGATFTFSLCEKCLSELFDTFKIPVDVR